LLPATPTKLIPLRLHPSISDDSAFEESVDGISAGILGYTGISIAVAPCDTPQSGKLRSWKSQQLVGSERRGAKKEDVEWKRKMWSEKGKGLGATAAHQGGPLAFCLHFMNRIPGKVGEDT
jgi:hypothetical protein